MAFVRTCVGVGDVSTDSHDLGTYYGDPSAATVKQALFADPAEACSGTGMQRSHEGWGIC